MAYTTVDDGSEYFTTTLWIGSGTSSGRSITNSANAGNFKPDWLWIKPRTGTNATHHQLYDSSRGVSKSLRSSDSVAEVASSAYGHVSAFDTNGFTSVAGSNNNENINENSSTFVAWQWKAYGGTTSSNDASATSVGTIDSVIQANTTAGFSIVTYTGTGSNGTIAHGLGATPQMYWVKRRSAAEHWQVYSEEIGNNKYFQITTDGEITGSNRWNNTSPTSSVFSVGDHASVNGSSDTYVAYCFTDIKGYSKFGSYTGNGNADGAFVYTGFKHAWLLVKRTDSANHWLMFDIKRDIINVGEKWLWADTADAEATGIYWDGLSNGFKARTNDPIINASGGTYVYMTFAEHPFVSSEGVPVTAR